MRTKNKFQARTKYSVSSMLVQTGPCELTPSDARPDILDPRAPSIRMQRRTIWAASDADVIRHMPDALRQWRPTEYANEIATKPGELAESADPRQQSAYIASLLRATAQLKAQVAARDELILRQADRMRLMALQLTSAEHRERKRLADLLHDHVQQLQVAAKMQIGIIGHEVASEEHKAMALGAMQLVQQAMDATRSLTTELHPPIFYEQGLAVAIQWLGHQTKLRFAVDVTTDLDPNAEPADEDVLAFLYQSVRELIFNAVKHARTSAIHVSSIVSESDLYCITVEDSGAGFNPVTLNAQGVGHDSQGLFRIAERIAALGGAMRIESEPFRGTCIHLELPLPGASRIVANQARQPLLIGIPV